LRDGIDTEKVRTKTGVKVTFYQAKTTRLDMTKLRAEVDVDKYMHETLSERVRVTLPKDAE